MSEEKTEKPSAKKLRKARLDGQVARSVELTGMTTFVVVCVVMAVTFPTLIQTLVGFLERSIGYGFAPPVMGIVFEDALLTLGTVLGPILICAFVAALVVGYVQIGPVFSTKAVLPDSKRINPSEGFKRIFSKDTLVQFAKHSGKLLTISAIAAAVYASELPILVNTGRLDFVSSWTLFGQSLVKLGTFMAMALLLFGIIDYLWQRHRFMKQMMMTVQEVKDEYKESEGDPSLKGQRRRLHREMLREASVGRVRDADAVVVNPTHIAVALRYDAESMNAPVVLSSGRGETAERIKSEAKRYGVPVVRNVPLARSLADLGLEEEIPEGLYDSVAEVLRYVYELENA